MTNIPPPSGDWYSHYQSIASISTTSGPSGRITYDLTTNDVPDWAREVLMSANVFVKGKGSGGTFNLQGGNLYFWTACSHMDDSTGMAAHQAVFSSAAGEISSTTITGWCPINQDNRKVYLQVDIQEPAAVDILGGTFYLMGYR